MARGALKMYRGDNTPFTITCSDDEGGVLDITGGQLWFTGKNNPTDTDADAVFQHYSPDHGIVLTDAANGIATITMDEADTAGLPGDTTLWWDVQCVDALGNVQTLARSVMLILTDITVATTTP
jgi:hypothetical protein